MSVTYETFQSDARDFLTKLGERTFWELPDEKRQAWFSGLCWSYCMLAPVSTEENERAIRTFEGISEEFARRTAMVICRGLPERRERL